MNDKIVLEIKNLSKIFKIHHEKSNTFFEFITSSFMRSKNTEQLGVLKNISFNLEKGKMLGIIGSNGSGKTTLLKIIAKIIIPDSGQVSITGKVVPFLELGTGFNAELTAKDNVLLYGLLLGFSKKEISDKLEKIIEFAELENFIDTKLKNFSTGMYARLAFSTAIQVDPDILLVDEVLSVGDESFQQKSFKKFSEFKQKGKTIVFVSHNLGQVKEFCDKVIWIDKGHIRLMGEPSKVVDEFIEFSNIQNN
jgi:lipopolysaccharide transport system ATP-binding protein|tara:strand:- start:415 stop:1167 length:753 start_codon:yes stop_codon:yes gene_type:complete